MVAIVKLRHRVIGLFDTETEYVFYACDNLRSGSIFVPVGKYNERPNEKRAPILGRQGVADSRLRYPRRTTGAVGRDDRMFVVKFTLESRRVSSTYNS